jgi:hypothetical protein
MEEAMFLIFNVSREIINLDNVVAIEATEFSDDEIKIFLVTTAIKFNAGSIFSPEQHNAFCREFFVKKEEWLKFTDAVKTGRNTFIFECITQED